MSAVHGFKPRSVEADVGHLYARMPGAARLRFAFKDMAAYWVAMSEFSGLRRLSATPGPSSTSALPLPRAGTRHKVAFDLRPALRGAAAQKGLAVGVAPHTSALEA
ncbi:hypothetical protein SAMN06265338_11661 [Rhodoblastus acidophilus]|uniref:Uncharacterized protein n=1 Tax=Rhodoblastus acidophilus TaxID=1074 RepID=A0A212S8Y4_RHOAC|nr:hypothetical protein [Rhodoblastus acidophilus]PPQ36852.1 hypothetical protein CKO16_16725 [Rhodoblastus acidophilus]RAI21438.1 hypothetical protein CH337_07885 [Rhodoblastus acidophilus]SNB81813.1 hypothetical protein SAMN06265338_11661 [Rhodoblastus acidophilus]